MNRVLVEGREWCLTIESSLLNPPHSYKGLQSLGHVAMAAEAAAKQVKADFEATHSAMASANQNSLVRHL